MAKVKLNAIISSINGKIGGTVFQNTAAGLIMKNSPQLPFASSMAQNSVNNYMYRCQYEWQALTSCQRQTWNSFAKFIKKSQHSQKDLFLNGQQLFIQFNFYRFLYGIAVLQNPQFVKDELTPIDGVISLVGAALTFTIDRPIISANEFLILQITTKVSPTINNPGSRYRSIIFTTTDAANWDISIPYSDVYGFVPVATNRLFYRYSLADKRNGVIKPFQSKLVTLT